MSLSNTARGYEIVVLDMSDKSEHIMIVAAPKPITAQVARDLAIAAYKRENGLSYGHSVLVLNTCFAAIGVSIPSPVCSDPMDRGCTNTARSDNTCGKCFHALKHQEVAA